MYLPLWIVILLVLLAFPLIIRLLPAISTLAIVLLAICALVLVSLILSGLLSSFGNAVVVPLLQATSPWSGYALYLLLFVLIVRSLVPHIKAWKRGEVGLFTPLLEGESREEYDRIRQDSEAWHKSRTYRVLERLFPSRTHRARRPPSRGA